MKRTGRTQTASTLRRYTQKSIACILSAVFVTACCPIAFAAEDPAGPLTPDELAHMTDEQIAALSQEQSDATLSKMAQLFQDGEKAELDEYLSALGFATTYEEHMEQKNEEWLEEQASLEPSLQPLWQSDNWGNPDKACHESLTSYGFLLYIGAMSKLFNMSESFGFTLADMQSLVDLSAWPDNPLSEQVGVAPPYGGHFYDPDTGANFWGITINTARTNGELYYNIALSSYIDFGDRSKAIANLAYTLHYVQDAVSPHHSANLEADLEDSNNHSGFEQLASQILLNENLVDEIEWEYDPAFYSACLNQNMGSFVHEIASFSKPFAGLASDKGNITRQRLAATLTLIATIKNTSGVLYKFAKDTKII